jgi:hypothetical protein
MATHSATTHIAAPRDDVWAHLADFGGIMRFNPNVTKSYSTSANNTGHGASRTCELTFPGATVDERIAEWNEGESMVVEIYGGEKLPPIENVQVLIAVAGDDESSIVTATMSYDTKYGPIGWVMDKLIVSRKFGRAFAGIFAGLKGGGLGPARCQ